MPIKINDKLPAKESLENENIFVMTETRAKTQDIRPLKILILNLMFSWAAGIATMGLVWWHRRTRVWAVPVLAAVLAAIGNWNGLCLPEVREVRLAYPNLPQELEGYRIVQVSDLHASTATRTVASCRESPPSFPAPATASSEDSIRSSSMSLQVAASVHGCQFVSLSLRN